MAYRDDVEALLARVDSLQRDLDAAADDKARIAELTAELDAARRELAAREERALVLTESLDTPSHPVRRRLRRWWFAIPLGGFTAFAIVMLTALFGSAAASCGGYKSFLIETVESCPRARELLGDDVGPASLGIACGSTETSGGTGNASWRMPFTGSRARGTLWFDLELHGGRWSMTRGTLEVGDETIDLVACATAGTPATLLEATVARCTGGDATACVAAGAMYEAAHDGAKARELYHHACTLEHAPGCRLEATLPKDTP